MVVTSLKRERGLLVVTAHVTGPRDAKVIHLALDTGASETLIKPEVLALVGYDAEHAFRTTTITSAIGVEPGYLLRVERLWALGFTVTNHVVHAHELPHQYDIDGLLGLRFLDRFDYTIRSRRNEIAVSLATL